MGNKVRTRNTVPKFPTLAAAIKTEVRKQKPTLGKFTRISKQRKPIETVEIKSAVPLVLSRITIATTLHQQGKTNLSFLYSEK